MSKITAKKKLEVVVISIYTVISIFIVLPFIIHYDWQTFILYPFALTNIALIIVINVVIILFYTNYIWPKP